MNTRLQVEHGVTELVYRVDIVEWMIRLAFGDLPDCSELEAGLKPSGAAVQVRLYAEDPYDNYKPTPGEIDATTRMLGVLIAGLGRAVWSRTGLTHCLQTLWVSVKTVLRQ